MGANSHTCSEPGFLADNLPGGTDLCLVSHISP